MAGIAIDIEKDQEMIVSGILKYKFGIEAVAAGSFENVLIIAVCRSVISIDCFYRVFSDGVLAENVCGNGFLQSPVVAEVVDADKV